MTTRREIIALVLLTLVVRSAAMFAQYGGLKDDPDLYRHIAGMLRTTGQFARTENGCEPYRTAFRPPLYPVLLAGVAWQGDVPDVSVAVLHVVLGVATVVGTFLLARRLGLHWAAWVAAMLVLFDPILVKQASLVMTETLAALLTVCAVAALVAWSGKPTWQRAAFAGAMIGLAALSRPTYLIWLPLVAGEIFLRGIFYQRDTRQLKHLAALIAGAVLVLSPWTIRNTLVFGKPIVATTHGGYTLYLGNNDYFYAFVKEGRWTEAWDASEFMWSEKQFTIIRGITDIDGIINGTASPFASTPAASQAEIENDHANYVNAKNAMQKQPGSFGLACLYRIWQFWSPLPNVVRDPDDRPATNWKCWPSLNYLRARQLNNGDDFLSAMRSNKTFPATPYASGMSSSTFSPSSVSLGGEPAKLATAHLGRHPRRGLHAAAHVLLDQPPHARPDHADRCPNRRSGRGASLRVEEEKSAPPAGFEPATDGLEIPSGNK